MNKAEILFDAITGVRPDLIEEAQNYSFHRRNARLHWQPFLAMAACLALAAFLGWGVGRGGDSGDAGTWNTAPSMGANSEDNSGTVGMDAPGGDTSNPGDADGGDTDSPYYGDGSAEAGDAPEDFQRTVTALVLETREDGLLVQVLSGDDALALQTFLLPASSLTAASGAAADDTVNVTWSGEVDWDSEPPVFLGEVTVETVQP